MSPIVFLHIPKTAGQAIHNALVELVGGEAHVSPIRVHSQAPQGPQMPPGFRLYSGHIDWVELENLPASRFTFTVLRDPRERIASFYFYMLDTARSLTPEELTRPERRGSRMILEHAADDYFLGGDAEWQAFVRDHYDNFYCSYFTTRKMRGRGEVAGLARAELLQRAEAGLAAIDGVYQTDGLDRLERDIAARFGRRISVAGRYFNTGRHRRDEARWPKLLARLERDGSAARLEAMAEADRELMQRILGAGRMAEPGGENRLRA